MARIHEIASLPPSRNHKVRRDTQTNPIGPTGETGPPGPTSQPGQSSQAGSTQPGGAIVGVKSRLRTGTLRRSGGESGHRGAESSHSPADDDISSEVEDILYDFT